MSSPVSLTEPRSKRALSSEKKEQVKVETVKKTESQMPVIPPLKLTPEVIEKAKNGIENY